MIRALILTSLVFSVAFAEAKSKSKSVGGTSKVPEIKAKAVDAKPVVETRLEKDIKDLDVQDAVPAPKLKERLYSVQMRNSPLQGRWEVLFGAAQNYSGSGFLSTSQLSLEGQYHLTDRLALAAAVSRVSNNFTSSAKNLQDASGYLPDVDYARWRAEVRAQANLFYGKFRMTRSQAMSFDQYVGLGPVANDMRSGTSVGAVADVGFAFWVSTWGSLHAGLKDYWYKENRTLSKGYTNNVHGYVQAGVLF